MDLSCGIDGCWVISGMGMVGGEFFVLFLLGNLLLDLWLDDLYIDVVD